MTRQEIYPNSDRGLLEMTQSCCRITDRKAFLAALRGIQEAAFRAGREDHARSTLRNNVSRPASPVVPHAHPE